MFVGNSLYYYFQTSLKYYFINGKLLIKTMNKIELIAFDLDGTLLTDKKQVSEIDLQSLKKLKAKGIILVAATGRNYYSVKKLLSDDFPMDYVVFSSGAGIMNWKTKEILKTWHLNENDIKEVTSKFLGHQLSFTIHSPIPDTHYMYLKLQDDNSHDLRNYTHFYKEFLQPLDILNLPTEATQMIALLNRNKAKFEELKNELKGLKISLTTSPVNNSSLWAEVFNANVSKANGIDWLCKLLNIKQQETFGIGNDYNDIDLLNYTQYSFVVENGIDELKEKFKQTNSNNENGFTIAINQVLDY